MQKRQHSSAFLSPKLLSDNSKRGLSRKSIEPKSSKNLIKEKPPNQVELSSHPAGKYILATPNISLLEFRKFVTLLYQGLFYSVCSLKGPSIDYVKKRAVKLPEKEGSKKKFLILDIDQTLIHSVEDNEPAQVVLTDIEDPIRMNVRPYCFEFLSKMSEYFEIYAFTSALEDYATCIVAYLNKPKRTIQGILSRNNCLETSHGFRIKDLRIIKNRGLEDIVIIDNMIPSFGLQIDNGIPILDFTNNKSDRELRGMQALLLNLKEAEDVRTFLAKNLALKKCLQHSEQEFVAVRSSAKKDPFKPRKSNLV